MGVSFNGFLGIDPGQKGAFVWLHLGAKDFEYFTMPLNLEGDVSFDGVLKILKRIPSTVPVFLERAIPFAMGTKHAFNYGRGFACLECALTVAKRSVTYIEPSKWAKVMHQGIDGNLKPKVKSIIALERLYPKLAIKVPRSPKSKKYHDGVMEALLIAGYAQRIESPNYPKTKIKISKSDF